MLKELKASPLSKSRRSSSIPLSIRVAMIIALIGGFFLVKPYLGVVVLSLITAYILSPIYNSLLPKLKNVGATIAATLLAGLMIIVIPIIFVIIVSVSQANVLLHNIQNSNTLTSKSLDELTEVGINQVNTVIDILPVSEDSKLTLEKVQSQIEKISIYLLNAALQFVQSVGTSVVGIFSSSILAVFLIASLLRYQDSLLGMIHRVSPFDKDLSDMYLRRAGIMTKAMLKGQVLIAIAQGFASAVSLKIAGIDYFWFFVVLLTFLSFIPLGGGIVTIPAAVIMILFGNIWQGVFIIAFHMLVVSSIDNLLRPKLVPKEAELNTAVMMLAVFSGMALFGTTGILIGPILMILIVTTFYVYGEYNRRTRRASLPRSMSATHRQLSSRA